VPFRVLLAEGSVTVEFDTPEEGTAAYEAVRPLIRYLGPAYPIDAILEAAPPARPEPPAPPSEEDSPPEDAAPQDDRPQERVSRILGGSGGVVARTYYPSVYPVGKAKGKAKILAWYRALRDIDSAVAGFSV